MSRGSDAPVSVGDEAWKYQKELPERIKPSACFRPLKRALIGKGSLSPRSCAADGRRGRTAGMKSSDRDLKEIRSGTPSEGWDGYQRE